MSTEADFFNSCAEKWDVIREENSMKLCQLIRLIGLQSGANVLDVGSGTGVLLPYIQEAIGPQGKITAMDFSAKMLEKAEDKFAGLGHISFVVCDIMDFLRQKPSVRYDAVISLNFFPHLGADKRIYIKKMHRLIRPNGSLVIMHDISRKQVNAIHGECAHVREDRLPQAKVVADWLDAAGYSDIYTLDNDEMYFVKGIATEKLYAVKLPREV
jgi:ubiquinone/menaquinone biosynthesis C-methylase UbiE